MTTHRLQSSRRITEFRLPPRWQLLTEANFDDTAIRHDVGEMVLERLKKQTIYPAQ